MHFNPSTLCHIEDRDNLCHSDSHDHLLLRSSSVQGLFKTLYTALTLAFLISCALARSSSGHTANSFSMTSMAACAYSGEACACLRMVLPLIVMTYKSPTQNLRQHIPAVQQ